MTPIEYDRDLFSTDDPIDYHRQVDTVARQIMRGFDRMDALTRHWLVKEVDVDARILEMKKEDKG